MVGEGRRSPWPAVAGPLVVLGYAAGAVAGACAELGSRSRLEAGYGGGGGEVRELAEGQPPSPQQ